GFGRQRRRRESPAAGPSNYRRKGGPTTEGALVGRRDPGRSRVFPPLGGGSGLHRRRIAGEMQPLGGLLDRALNPIQLIRGQLRIHRQREPFCREGLRAWKIPTAMTKSLVGSLQMKRDGIVQPGLDALSGELLAQLIAAIEQHHVEVVHVGSGWMRLW